MATAPVESRKSAEQELGGRVIAGQLGRYRVEGAGWLGGGSSANVFLAMNEYTMERVAVKAIDRYQIEESARKRELLTRELNIATKLKHPNIINLMEVIFDENYVMLIMELANGGELYNAVKDGAMAEPRAQWVFHQIVSALDYCHSNGVCHRDLKLENLMLVGADEQVKVTDFGLSKDCSIHSQPVRPLPAHTPAPPPPARKPPRTPAGVGRKRGGDIFIGTRFGVALAGIAQNVCGGDAHIIDAAINCCIGVGINT